MSPLWVSGQVVEYKKRPGARMAFFVLRDADQSTSMTVKCWPTVLDSLGTSFSEGAQVVVHAKPDFYEGSGSLSLMAKEVHTVGVGNLLAQIEALRKKLAAEGLFAQENKQPLPVIPRRIGLVVGRNAKAKQDVMVNALARWPLAEFEVQEVAVQGPTCATEVTRALKELDASPQVEVIVISRGGGAVEDLLPFSEESLVRAASAARTPLVSAIGHEDDWTLIDLAADLRASTPTDAAKKVVPDVHEQWQLIGNAIDRMRMRIDARVGNEIRLVEGYANRPSLTQPLTMLEPYQRFVDDARRRMDIGLTRIVDDASLTVEKLHASLTALSPQSTLDRGYAVVQNADGHVIDDAGKVSAGDHLTLTLRKGVITATAQ